MKTENPIPTLGDLAPPPGTLPAESKTLLDTAALAALAMSPSMALPDTIFPAAALRIRRREVARKTARRALTWGGWATAAAACAVLWLRDSNAGAVQENKNGKTGIAGGAASGAAEDPLSTTGTGAAAHAAVEKRAHASPQGQFRTLPVVSRQFTAERIGLLPEHARPSGDSQNSRFQPAPGLARMVVVEMTAPGTQGKHTLPPNLTPERVSDIIAAGLTGERPPETNPDNSPPGDKPPMKIRPGSRPSEIILEDGLGPLGFLDLPEEVTLRHNAFPVTEWENAGLVRSPDGRFYDPAGRILWEPGTGGQYLGRRAPEGFDASQFTTAPPSPAVEAEPAAPVAYTLFDETTGAGSIVLGNLPAAPEGRAYQLWLIDSGQQNPVSVGLLPELEGGAGRVFFDTLAPGFAPSGYFLTLESATGSTQPSGERVLSGPQIPAK